MNARSSNLAPAGRDMNGRAHTALPPANDESLAGRAEIVLLTTDGADFRRVGVEALAGLVTLRGKVNTESEKEQAADAVRRVDGVHDVNNLLEVAPERLARASDQALKDRIEAALKSDKTFEGVRVASVRDGVVRVSGNGIAVAEKLRAIELAWNVDGVASETKGDA